MADAVYFLGEDDTVRHIDTNLDDKSYDKRVFDCLKAREEYQPQGGRLTYGVDGQEGMASIGEPVRPVPCPQSATYLDCVGWGVVCLWLLLVGTAAFTQRMPGKRHNHYFTLLHNSLTFQPCMRVFLWTLGQEVSKS